MGQCITAFIYNNRQDEVMSQ